MATMSKQVTSHGGCVHELRTELHPVRTMEAKLVGPITFSMKPKYDLVKRSLPLTIIRPAEFYEGGPAEEVPDRSNT